MHEGRRSALVTGACMRPASSFAPWPVLALILLVLSLAASPVAAQLQATPSIVLDIKFEGVRHTNQGELLTKLATRAGATLEGSSVTRDIKTLFALGYFDDVRVQAQEVPGQGYILFYMLSEKARLVSIRIEGNYIIDSKTLFEAITLNVGSFFSKAAINDNEETLRGKYREKGYFKVQINQRITETPEGDKELVFAIEEKGRYYITEIITHGNTVFTDLDILRIMQSAEVDCFNWANDSGLFDEYRINADLQAITTKYLELGYIKVFIDRPKVVITHTRDYSRIRVEMTITEGAQYFTRNVDIQGDILGDKQEILDRLRVKTGEPHNPLLRNQDRFMLSEMYQEQGYAFVRAAPQISIDEQNHQVDVTYHLNKGDKAYIGRIEFQGNKETRDYVVRREFEVREDELFNGRLLRESHRNLMALGYFKPSLRVDTRETEVDNRLDVVTKMEEAQTGTLQGQLGYSDQSGTSVSLSVSKGNFLGRGQTFRTTLEWSQRNVTSNFSIDFIEPHLFDTEISSDSSASYRTLDDQSELDRGTIREVRLSQGIGYPIVRFLKINFSLSTLERDFQDKDTNDARLNTFGTSLEYNTVNHPVFPSEGSKSTISVAQIGGAILGGTTEYRRYRTQWQKFFALNRSNSLVLMTKARLGWLEKVGDHVIPVEDRFRLGGITSLRGYNYNDLGGPYGQLEQERNLTRVVSLDEFGQPVLDADGNLQYQYVDQRTLGMDQATIDQLQGGGITERLFNADLLFPLAGDNLRGVLFFDAGQVNAEREMYKLLGEKEPDFFDLKMSTGFGIRMITPVGVFRFEYGVKLNPGEGESPDKFDFTISSLF